jgi:dihydrofolate reductase
MMVNMILAVCDNLAIGNGKNGLCIHSKEDLANFKQLTSGGVVVMGRNTFMSLPNGPLPNRTNVVITSSNIDGVACFPTVQEALSAFAGQPIWIIGGARLFEEGIQYTNTVWLTVFEHDCGETALRLNNEFYDYLVENFTIRQSTSITNGKIIQYQRSSQLYPYDPYD